MKIDIGSGGFKRPGFVGLDIVPGDGVDLVCDIERERWPINDDTVEYAFSSHCFEHVVQANLVHIFQELTRVCRHGATIEIWNPYAFHRDGYVLGHITYLTEEIYHHLCGLYDTWAPMLGARWHLREIRYHVPPDVLARLQAAGISTEIAITHMNQVVKESGVFIVIDKTASLEFTPYERVIVDELPSIPMRETRDRNPVVLSIGPGGSEPPLINPMIEAEQAAQLTEAAAALSAAHGQITTLETQIAGLQAEITALRSSRSWRSMEPVRRLSNAVRGRTTKGSRAA